MKIRVLQVLATLRRAGAERMAVTLALRLDGARYETAVVSLYHAFPDGLETALEGGRVRVWHLGKRGGPDPRMYPRLLRVFREFRPDVIHTHSYVLRYTLPAALLAQAQAMVHTVHNVAGREVDRLGRMVHRVAFRCGVQPVAIAAEVARSFQTVYGREPAATIPNGIELDGFRRPVAKEEWRRANGFASGDILLMSVARLEPQKDPIGLIQCFAQALAGDDRCHLLMAGDGSLRDAVREYAAACGVAGRVHLLGVRTDVPALLAAADIFVLASRWEGNPVAIMEAMASGLPVAAMAVGGVPELVEEGKTGLLAPPGDTEALGEAIALLSRDAELRRQLGQAARLRSEAFGAEAMAASYSALYERLLGVRP